MAGMIHIQKGWNDETDSPALKCCNNGRHRPGTATHGRRSTLL